AAATPKCFVIGCPNGAEDQPLYPGVTLHNFPTEFSKVKVWLRQSGQHLGNPDLLARRILSNRRNFWMCSSHFGPDSYSIHGSAVNLKPDAVPTIFPKFEDPAVKEEEDGEELQPAGAADTGCHAAFTSKEEIDECVDEERRVRHVATTTDPHWGVRSVGVLTRPILMKEAATCTSNSRFGKNAKFVKLQRHTADKGVQCSTFDLSFDGDARSARPDYFYQAGAFQSPGEAGFDKPFFGAPPHWNDESGLDGADQECNSSGEGIPVKDSRLFLALEDVLISLMQHMVSSSFIEESAKLTTHRILRQTLEIIGLLTGDKWVIGEEDDAFENPDEVPVKCGDVGVYFSPDEWDYIEAHKEMYIDIIPEDPLLTESQQDLASGEESASEDEAKPSPDHQNSPEWKPQSDRSDFSDSELSTDEDGGSDSSKKRKTEDAFLGNPEIKIEYSADGRSRTFWCLRCNISLKDRRGFRSHLKTQRHLNYRADEEEVACDDCSQVFNTRSALVKHKAENHANKRYACTICGLEYDYISQFIIHQRAHTGEKPFECDKCGKRFGHKCTLLVHHRRHLKGKTVKCSKCDRLFDTKSQLHRHERIHVPKKPFKCPVCGKQFEQKSLFTRHKWEHEEEAKQDPKFAKQTREGSAAPDSPPNDVPQGS
ncbi:PREDICTED: oocyte zinc finger protein XlCOF7.1-like, partial [Nanorana parkeri]|uniref:oocyte zinc finger protein XlCOF7.1-like n=1 Tax=Nanorana parkeri TaxID=125878 RepID=UPI000854D40C